MLSFWPHKFVFVSVGLMYSVSAQLTATQPSVVAEFSHQPWYKAWYKDEIESDLSSLGFNATFCAEWYKHIPENHKEDYQYAMEVGELCDRLSENEADHYEAEREYQSDLKKRKKLRDSLINLIVKLSNYSNERIELLTARVFPKPDNDDTCYQKVYGTFSESCVKPEVDPNVKKYRRVFANACAQNWLNVDMICQQIRETCDETGLE